MFKNEKNLPFPDSQRKCDVGKCSVYRYMTWLYFSCYIRVNTQCEQNVQCSYLQSLRETKGERKKKESEIILRIAQHYNKPCVCYGLQPPAPFPPCVCVCVCVYFIEPASVLAWFRLF